MSYKIRYTPEAVRGLTKLEKNEPKAFAKVLRFIEDLKEHPKSGLGHPEPLKGNPEGRWSREITKKYRMVYQIFEEEVVVLVLTAYGHYGDK